MPTPYIEKLAKEGKGTVKELESKWNKAKKIAADEGHAEEYDYITGVFQRMVKATKANADEVQSAFIGVDMTLFIRLLEIAREELKTDEALHRLAEKCSKVYAAKGAALTMYDYDELVSVLPANQATEPDEQKTPEYSEPKALARLAAQETAGTVQDAAAAIQKILSKNKLSWTAKAKKGDSWIDAHINISGKTTFGRIEFDCFLSPKGDELVFDFWDSTGLYDFNYAVGNVLDKFKFKFGAGTSMKNLLKAEADAISVSKARKAVDSLMGEAEDVHDRFIRSINDISSLMQRNAVKK